MDIGHIVQLAVLGFLGGLVGAYSIVIGDEYCIPAGIGFFVVGMTVIVLGTIAVLRIFGFN